jgi:hypothetical protein
MKVAIFGTQYVFEPAFRRNHLLARWFLAWLILDPEDEGDTFLRNAGSYTDYTVAVSQNMVTFITLLVAVILTVLKTEV